jgi:hypothetical protein
MRTKLGSTKSFDTRDTEWLFCRATLLGRWPPEKICLKEEDALHRYHGSESTVRCKVHKSSGNMHRS